MKALRAKLAVVGVLGCAAFLIFEATSPRFSSGAGEHAAKAGELPFIQPDYAAWQSLKKGMDENDIAKIVGQPTTKTEGFDRHTDVMYTWEFGYVAPKSLAFPRPLTFKIWFLHGKATQLEDPFWGDFSKDGKPTMPKPCWPEAPPAYTHYPRWMDCRWTPSSGVYPMHYEVEISNCNGGDPAVAANWRVDKVAKSDIPYVSVDFVAGVPGKWRVRAMNEKGTTDWSDYCQFSFSK